MTDSSTSHYFESDGLRLHYLSWGDSSSPVVLLLHGIRGYARTWTRLASELAPLYRVIALDQRGRGSSDWSATARYYTDDYVADVRNLLAHLGARRVSILGHSLGGSNALVFAQRFPEVVARLIIEDIGPGSSQRGKGANRIVRELETTPLEFSSWQEAWEFWRAARPLISNEAVASRVEETLREDERGRVVWRFDFAGIKAARLDAARDPSKLPDLWPSVESLRCPTLLLRGERSDFLPRATALEMARRNARVEFVEIANATHYVHDDNYDDFAAEVKRFLAV